jgi:phosphoglycerate dehydrogenase-like enzyme
MVDAAFVDAYEVFWVFNTSRGIIVTADLVSAMNTGKVLGAWMY